MENIQPEKSDVKLDSESVIPQRLPSTAFRNFEDDLNSNHENHSAVHSATHSASELKHSSSYMKSPTTFVQLSEALVNSTLDTDDGFVFDGELHSGFMQELHGMVELYANLTPASILQTEEPRISLDCILPFLMEPIDIIREDEFSRCFLSRSYKPWNWTIYMFPAWLAGVFVRYFILFPARLFSLLLASALTVVSILVLKFVVKDKKRRLEVEGKVLTLYAQAWVMSWSGVVRYHGSWPKSAANQVYVANHSSLIDYILLLCLHPFSVVGQKQDGLVGILQTHLLASLGCIWFDRKNIRNREAVRASIKAHVTRGDVPPLLIFPEGTCVNNEYCVMFKRGAFELDVDVIPVAIKYNKLFADAFWNSRAESFASHILRLMKSWCVIADVWFLPPQRIAPDETPDEFANRVKQMICKQAQLSNKPYDGYLKHIAPSQKYVQARQMQAARWFKKELADYRLSRTSEQARKAVLQQRQERFRFFQTIAVTQPRSAKAPYSGI